MTQKYKHIIFYTLHGNIKNRFIKSEFNNLDASKYALIGATESHELPIKKKELYNMKNIHIIDKIHKIHKIYN
jgi:hypothetical protein